MVDGAIFRVEIDDVTVLREKVLGTTDVLFTRAEEVIVLVAKIAYDRSSGTVNALNDSIRVVNEIVTVTGVVNDFVGMAILKAMAAEVESDQLRVTELKSSSITRDEVVDHVVVTNSNSAEEIASEKELGFVNAIGSKADNFNLPAIAFPIVGYDVDYLQLKEVAFIDGATLANLP